MKQRDPIQFGKHTLTFEEPGIAVHIYRGPITVDDMRILVALPDMDEHEGKFQLALFDMQAFGGLDSTARKMGAERPRPAGTYYSAYVGATFKMRVVVALFMRAANLLQGQKNVSAFFEDHESAKAWLIACREKHLAADKR
ncbi:hypothetical protein [Polyangium jinanense]|uniref:STAS/SEC14 domain-containing protein n=1 Tax=Polyangium jinanense TaxID=2829994 RepID=A0A9X3XE35_9BACT|nr:hypothetical protein [Polyangium jinanense]MDC3961199.1 hypothetical protein [Polyangium jinanense]MDC3988607.1 hypothetical protein [Polyangium jinanense]